IAFDKDGCVFERRTAIPVNQGSAFDDERGLLLPIGVVQKNCARGEHRNRKSGGSNPRYLAHVVPPASSGLALRLADCAPPSFELKWRGRSCTRPGKHMPKARILSRAIVLAAALVAGGGLADAQQADPAAYRPPAIPKLSGT